MREPSRFYLELPGQKVRGTFSEKNEVVLLKARTFYVKIEHPDYNNFELSCSDQEFYVPKMKQLKKNITFSAGEEVEIRVAKSFDKTITVTAKNKEGNLFPVREFHVPALDSNAYSDLEETPAPILFEVKPVAEEAPTAGAQVPASPTFRSDDYSPIPQEQKDNSGCSTSCHDLPQSPPSMPAPDLLPSHAPTQPSSCHTWVNTQFARDVKLFASNQEEQHTLIVELNQAIYRLDIAGKFEIGKEYLIAAGKEPKIQSLMQAVFKEAWERGFLLWDLWGSRFKLYHNKAKNKVFISFSGNARLREIARKALFAAGVPYGPVKAITVGLGTWEDAGTVAKKELKNMFNPKTSTGAFYYLALAVDTLNWIESGSDDAVDLLTTFVNSTVVYAATSYITPYVITALVLAIGIPVEITACLIIGGALVAIGVGWGINSIAERLGIKQILYDFLVNSTMAQVYRKQAKEDPEWVPWYF